jgi:diadenylate cyclase
VVADYLPPHRSVEDTLIEMSRLRDDDVLDPRMALNTLHLSDVELTSEIAPKGLRLLSRVSVLSGDLAARIANHFGGLARLQRATVDDLMKVDGVDKAIAASVKETLARVTENTILDQYS